MKTEYRHLIPEDFSADSRVWIYQCNRMFSISEALAIEEKLNRFTSNWQSHGTPVKGIGLLFFGQFIILMADEKATGVSGCSTDSSVRMIKEIEQDNNVQLFDRTMLAFVVKEKTELLPLAQLQYAFENRFITPDTLYFNNLVLTKEALLNQWIIPVKDSWLAARLKLNQAH